MIFPDRERFTTDMSRYTLVPVFEEIRAEFESPNGLFLKSGGEFFLESVEKGEHVGRYSIITKNELVRIVLDRSQVQIKKQGEKDLQLTVENPFDYAAEYLKKFNCPEYTGLPPFYSGIIGYLGYESIQYFAKVPIFQDESDIPDGIMIIPEYVLVFDSVKRTIFIIVTVLRPDALSIDMNSHYDAAKQRIQVIKQEIGKSTVPAKDIREKFSTEYCVNETDRSDFIEKVRKCKDYVHQGEIIQAVLSRRKEIKTELDPFCIYQALRQLNPSPYLFFLNLKRFHLIGSSPEVLVKIQDGLLLTKPIAGTRKRAENAATDQRQAECLLADPKERSEHLMLVDLARNDLGKVSTAGSVEVTDFMQIEKYSHVMHLVSTVKGRLDKRFDSFDVIRAAFPAGTLTGAPKKRAMEIISELEQQRRGPYGGMVFYLGFNGNMDSCITIRTIVHKDGIAYLQAGAGIVNDSKPEAEFEETENKLSALYDAIFKIDTEINGGNNHGTVNR